MPGTKDAYFAGDIFSVSVNVDASGAAAVGDLYVAAQIAGVAAPVFFTGDAAVPLSWAPTAVAPGISIEDETYDILSLKLPPVIGGLEFTLMAVINTPGTALSPAGYMSNLAEAETKFIATPADQADRNQSLFLRGLKTLSGQGGFSVKVNDGMVGRLQLGLPIPKSALAPGSTDKDLAQFVLSLTEPLLRVKTPKKNLRLVRITGETMRTLHFRQYYRDMPVFGSWFEMVIVDEIDSFTLLRMGGNYSPGIDMDIPSNLLGERDALRKVMEAKGLGSLPELELVVPAKLWLFDRGLLAPRCPKCEPVQYEPRIAWRVIFFSGDADGATTDVFVDAMTGAVLHERNRTDGIRLRLFTAQSNASRTCYAAQATRREQWYNESGECDYLRRCGYHNYCEHEPWGCTTPSDDGRDANEFTRDVYNFFHDEFGRESYNDRDYRYWAYVHACFKDEPCPTRNAASIDCGAYRIHIFGDGMATLDVVGHEFGHSFHNSEADYTYSNESGALAEHIADMFGHFVGYWTGKDTDWKIMEDSVLADPVTGCGRDMSDPPICSDPDHYDDYIVTAADHGGVHTNSSILNKGGYLLVDGGTHHDVTVRGIGETKARHIYYRTVTNKLGDSTGFERFSELIRDACDELVGSHGIRNTGGPETNDCCQVRNAFAAVGLGDPDADCDGTVDRADRDDDGDGIDDGPDNCNLVPNPRQDDTDGDLIGDACDTDADGDGRDNDDDNCELTANPGQADRDGDGEGDACDDSDGDRIVDASDNCPTTYNPDQGNVDGDAQGDVCDGDRDNDGIANLDDNCMNTANPGQADTEPGGGDRVGDACDNCVAVDNHDQRDTDDDGEGDACDDDIDGDGVLNDNDRCPEEWVDTPEWYEICPEDVFCRRGCPPQHTIEGVFAWQFGLPDPGDLDPSATRPLARRLLDPCRYGGPCEAQSLFAENTYLNVSLDVSMEPPADTTFDTSMLLHIGVMDEAGRWIAGGVMEVGNEMPKAKTTKRLDLSFRPVPSYTWRETGKYTAPDTVDQALPLYYLVVQPELGDEKNRVMLEKTPITISATISLGTRDQTK